mmetsp:Transcript_12860/g.38858  ORF Transcript_12860/g.38858 Transcript_12860/m.38858 type:complete len:333 (+) Transcript_12860:1379-2377(+)
MRLPPPLPPPLLQPGAAGDSFQCPPPPSPVPARRASGPLPRCRPASRCRGRPKASGGGSAARAQTTPEQAHPCPAGLVRPGWVCSRPLPPRRDTPAAAAAVLARGRGRVWWTCTSRHSTSISISTSISPPASAASASAPAVAATVQCAATLLQQSAGACTAGATSRQVPRQHQAATGPPAAKAPPPWRRCAPAASRSGGAPSHVWRWCPPRRRGATLAGEPSFRECPIRLWRHPSPRKRLRPGATAQCTSRSWSLCSTPTAPPGSWAPATSARCTGPSSSGRTWQSRCSLWVGKPRRRSVFGRKWSCWRAASTPTWSLSRAPAPPLRATCCS